MKYKLIYFVHNTMLLSLKMRKKLIVNIYLIKHSLYIYLSVNAKQF